MTNDCAWVVNAILPHTLRALERGRSEGLHSGAQLYVSLRGETVVDAAVGEARTGIEMRPDTITPWLSSGKPITAVAIAQQVERGSLTWDAPVASVVPEFAEGGKHDITLRHLLTHTAGFRGADKLPPDLTWDETIARICQTPLEDGWVPGAKAGYQMFSSWFALGEMVQRVSRQPFTEYVSKNIFEPLGMADSWLGMPAVRLPDYAGRVGFLHVSERGSPLRLLAGWDTEESCLPCRPGSNALGPVRELARFYEALLKIRGDVAPSSVHIPVLQPETARLLTARHRIGMFDETFRHTLDWGLGFLINSHHHGAATAPYGYGPYASPDAFGHSGSQSSCAFADPQHGLVVAWHCNGQPGEPRHQRRAREINTLIYEELGLK